MNKKAWGLKSSKTIMNREENTLQHSLVIPSVMMSVILQQEESILMLSWSTTSTWKQREQFTLEAKGMVHTGSKGNSSHLEAKGTVHTWRAPAVTLASADHIRLQKSPETEF